MEVRVINRKKTQHLAGHESFEPVIETVTISNYCPRCGKPRGTPMDKTFFLDGFSYTVDYWQNPCGHMDMYYEVLEEAERMKEAENDRDYSVIGADREVV